MTLVLFEEVGSAIGRLRLFGPLRSFRDDEGGFTSLAVMLAVVLAMVLLALAMQAYWVNSVAPDIQSVADAGALAGANVISKVVTVVAMIDAVAFAVTLVAGSLALIGGVLFIIPVTSVAGKAIINAAMNLNDLKNGFLINDARPTLIRLAEAAPYLAAGNAVAIMLENGRNMPDGRRARYIGLAIPLPLSVKSTVTVGQPGTDLSKQGDQMANNPGAKDILGQIQTQTGNGCAQEIASSQGQWTVPLVPQWTFLLSKDRFRSYFADRKSSAETRVAAGGSSVDGWKAEVAFYGDLVSDLVMGGSMPALPTISNPGQDISRLSDPMFNLGAGWSRCNQIRDAAGIARLQALYGEEVSRIDGWNRIVVSYDLVTSLQNKLDQYKQTGKDALEAIGAEILKLVQTPRLTVTMAGRDGVICVVADPETHMGPGWAAILGGGDVQVNPRVAISAARLTPGNGPTLLTDALSNDGGSAKALPFRWGLGFADFMNTAFGTIIDRMKQMVHTVTGWFGPLGDVFGNWVTSTIDETLKKLNLTLPNVAPPIPTLENSGTVAANAVADPERGSVGGLAQMVVTAKQTYNAVPSMQFADFIRAANASIMGSLESDLRSRLKDAFTIRLSIGSPVDLLAKALPDVKWINMGGGLTGIAKDLLNAVFGQDNFMTKPITMPFEVPVPSAWTDPLYSAIHRVENEIDIFARGINGGVGTLELW